MKNVIEFLKISFEKTYRCLCTHCNHSWTSKSKPEKCPECGSGQVIYTDLE